MASKEYINKLKEAEGVGKVTAILVAEIYETEEALVEALTGPGPVDEDVQEHREALAKIFVTKKAAPKRVDVRNDALTPVEVRVTTGLFKWQPGSVLSVPSSLVRTQAFRDLQKKLLLTVLA